jgi:hypothetical protein
MNLDPSPPFEFSMLEKAKQSILRILARADTIGLRVDVERWLKHLDIELRYHPRTWGDPIRNLRKLQQVQFRGRVAPFFAYYSVHERVPMVILGDVIVDADHPLARG